jgi:hypothetical protein
MPGQRTPGTVCTAEQILDWFEFLVRSLIAGATKFYEGIVGGAWSREWLIVLGSGGIVDSVVSKIERRGGSDSTRADGRGGADTTRASDSTRVIDSTRADRRGGVDMIRASDSTRVMDLTRASDSTRADRRGGADTLRASDSTKVIDLIRVSDSTTVLDSTRASNVTTSLSFILDGRRGATAALLVGSFVAVVISDQDRLQHSFETRQLKPA